MASRVGGAVGRRVVTEDLSNVEFETSEDVEVIPTFDSMGLREDLLRGIYAYGSYVFRDVESSKPNCDRLSFFSKYSIVVME